MSHPSVDAQLESAYRNLVTLLAHRLATDITAATLAAIETQSSRLAEKETAPQAPSIQAQPDSVDRIIWRCDLPKLLNRSSETVRRWIRAGKLPEPDVQLSLQTWGWRLSTLRRAGIDVC